MGKKANLKLVDRGAKTLNHVAKALSKNAPDLGKLIPIDKDLIKRLNVDLDDFGRSGKIVRRFVRDNPGAALLLAAGVGFLLANSDSLRSMASDLLGEEHEPEAEAQRGAA